MTTTLPRDIIKWIQGLDLSYSVKDVRRDLSNGFLIAEILSRYYPGQVPMHSFDNSQKKERKQNNWQLLEKIFEKQEIPITKKDFEKVLEESDLNTLINFMVKFFKELTGKKINRNALNAIQSFNKTFASNAKEVDSSQSFLLKEKGLEKIQEKDILLEEKKVQEREEAKLKEEKGPKESIRNSQVDAMKNSSLSTSNKLKTFLKYEQRPISQRPELSNLKFEVKSTNIRPLNINVSKLRASKEQQQTMTLGASHYTQTSHEMPANFEKSLPTPGGHQQTMTNSENNKTQNSRKDKIIEKSVYDILKEYLDMKFMNSSFIHEYQNQFSLKSYPELIASYNDNFNAAILKEIFEKADPIASFILRDLNETWKFLNFMLGCLKNVSIEKEYFKTIIDTLRHIGERTVNRDPHKSLKLLKENFLEMIYQQIATAAIFEKKEYLAMLLYYFIPNTPESKCQVILALKEIAKDHKIFMQILVILLSSEKDLVHPLNQETLSYLNLAMKHAKAGIQSSHPVIKTMSLAILANLARLNYELVMDFTKSRLEELALEEWWEDKCQVIMICSRIIHGLITTDNYQNLVKKNTMNFTKNYSWQNEVIANKLKEDVKLFGDTIIRILQSKPNNYVVRVFIVYCVDICHEVKGIMDQTVSILTQSNSQFRDWFFHNKEDAKEEFFVYNDKSLRYMTSFNSEDLKDNSKEFLLSLVENVKENNPIGLDSSHLEILEFGLLHTDFKVLNVEMLLGIANLFTKYIFIALCDLELYDTANQILKFFLSYRLDQDLKIKDLEILFANALVQLYQSQQESCITNMKDMISWYRDEVDRKKVFREKNLFKDILQSVQSFEIETTHLEEIQNFMTDIINSLEIGTEPERR